MQQLLVIRHQAHTALTRAQCTRKHTNTTENQHSDTRKYTIQLGGNAAAKRLAKKKKKMYFTKDAEE